jgi:hypothetical protein
MARVKLFRVSFLPHPYCSLLAFHWFEEGRWPACRAYSAEVASATKAGSSGAGTAPFFNTPSLSCFAWRLDTDGSSQVVLLIFVWEDALPGEKGGGKNTEM